MYRIRQIREDRDLSQETVARVIKTTQQQYSKIETGRADISGEKLILLAEGETVYLLNFLCLCELNLSAIPLSFPFFDKLISFLQDQASFRNR